MGFNRVYQCLLDIFPQVDQRILKAVAIENSKDVDAAAETILTEILPYLTKKSTPSALKGKAPIILLDDDVSSEAESSHLGVQASLKEARPSPSAILEDVLNDGLIFQDSRKALRPSPLIHLDKDENVSYQYSQGMPVEFETPGEPEVSAVPNDCHESSDWNVMWDSVDWQTATVSVVAVPEERQNVPYTDQSMPVGLEISAVPNLPGKENINHESVDTDGEELILLGKITEKGAEFGSNENVHIRSNSLDADNGSENVNNFHPSLDEETQQLDSQGINEGINSTDRSATIDNTISANGSCTAVGGLNNDSQESDGSADLDTDNCKSPLSHPDVGIKDAATHIVSSSTQENIADSQEDCLHVQTDYGHQSSSVSETTDVDVSADCQSKRDSVNEMDNNDNEPHLDVTDTRSSQICRIDMLEEIIEDAKSNKKTMFQAMQSVMDLMREVELEEQAAEQAKLEAAAGGLNILAKVEEFKQMLAHAKEANDMHAGEVYGEKAILATEVRELRSRLVGISEERDQSLALLDEMRQSLEARQAAADEARKEAEREKLEKEESALNALAEQEAIMEKVVQESEVLQQEAEENSKLREFLMDRGHVVDSLQGEISVICQDVRLLKQKFDERVPFSKSISSSQTSFLLASSSSSSLKSIAGAFVANPVESAKTPEKTSPAASVGGQSPKSRPEDDQSGVCKAPSDDDWDFFD